VVLADQFGSSEKLQLDILTSITTGWLVKHSGFRMGKKSATCQESAGAQFAKIFYA
jgi:hypothetical protein